MIDTMAQRYGVMPSKILASADVFDLYVMETSLGYQEYLDSKEKLNQGEITPSNQHMLKDMLEQVKGAANAR